MIRLLYFMSSSFFCLKHFTFVFTFINNFNIFLYYYILIFFSRKQKDNNSIKGNIQTFKEKRGKSKKVRKK